MNPLKDMKVTSPFGKREAPIQGASTYHSGVDLSAKVGTECYAITDGVVKIARNYPQGIGTYLIIEHDGYCTTYGHLSKLKVKEGQIVKEGQCIALSGNTGNSGGPHLHFEVRKIQYGMDYWDKVNNFYKGAVDPIEFLKKSPYEEICEKANEWAKENNVSSLERLEEPIKRQDVIIMLYKLLGGTK